MLGFQTINKYLYLYSCFCCLDTPEEGSTTTASSPTRSSTNGFQSLTISNGDITPTTRLRSATTDSDTAAGDGADHSLSSASSATASAVQPLSVTIDNGAGDAGTVMETETPTTPAPGGKGNRLGGGVAGASVASPEQGDEARYPKTRGKANEASERALRVVVGVLLQ